MTKDKFNALSIGDIVKFNDTKAYSTLSLYRSYSVHDISHSANTVCVSNDTGRLYYYPYSIFDACSRIKKATKSKVTEKCCIDDHDALIKQIKETEASLASMRKTLKEKKEKAKKEACKNLVAKVSGTGPQRSKIENVCSSLCEALNIRQGTFDLRRDGNYEHKGFYLSEEYTWKIVKDDRNVNVLVGEKV